MVLVSPCSRTGAEKGARRADWNEEEAPGQDMVMIMVMFIMVEVMVMFIKVLLLLKYGFFWRKMK